MWYTCTLSIFGITHFYTFAIVYFHVGTNMYATVSSNLLLVFLLDIYFNNCYFPLAWIISNANTNRKKHKLSLKICYVIEILTCDGYFNDKNYYNIFSFKIQICLNETMVYNKRYISNRMKEKIIIKNFD